MDTKFPKNIFDSARLKLTFFYLVIVLFFSIFSTLTYRYVAQHAYKGGDLAQANAIQHLYNRGLQGFPFFRPNNDDIAGIQTAQETQVQHQLDVDVIEINLAALILGGVLSWWFAGRALYPIEEAHESQKRFASDASHELRTPLASMKVENEVFLRQKDFSSNEARNLIESNLEEVQRLENLSENLLLMTQYENVALKLRQLSVKDIVDKSILAMNKGAKAKKIKFNTELSAQRVYGNGNSLIQLLSIVIDNAIKYSPNGKTIHITGTKRNLHYHLAVRDEGNGIKPSDLPYIFDRFFRGDRARQSNGGYGLGLSLAREIAKANNARISASNVKDGGAEFLITLNTTKV